MAKIPDANPETIADAIGKAFASLTRAERQLANTIVENYPVSGLGSITQVAEKAGVSSPTIVRMEKSWGLKAFPNFKPDFDGNWKPGYPDLSPNTITGCKRPRIVIF